MHIALLHLAPRVGDLTYNRRHLETGIETAAEMGADWIVTPELCLPGYDFAGILGTDWIANESDSLDHFRKIAADRLVTLFLGHPERDARTDRLYNSVFVIGRDGAILGTHRKRSVIPGVEAWATRGEDPAPVQVSRLSVGIMVCADAYTSGVADRLQEQGAEILISCAAWGPMPHGPERCWEERTRETKLPLFVCNRTGKDRILNFDDAESVVVKDGERLVSFSGLDSSVVFIDWDHETKTVNQHLVRKLSGPTCARSFKEADVVPSGTEVL